MAVEDQVTPFDHFTDNYANSCPVVTDGLEAATQSWVAGAPLISSGGRLAEAADDPTSGIVGFACADASGVTDTAVSYIPARAGIEFEATLEDQANGDHVLVLANKYALFGIRQRTSNGAWYLNENDASGIGRVISFVEPVGTIQARVRAIIVDGGTIYAA
jgi:hypothetical protein